jgi:hypothetical protein
MKIRLGFVSNSSSSSFVVLGRVISDEEYKNLSDDLKEDISEDDDLLYVESYYDPELGKGEWLMGEILVDVDTTEEYLPREVYEVDKILAKAQSKVNAICDKYGFSPTIPKILIGTRPS